jgi:hypothetical protein
VEEKRENKNYSRMALFETSRSVLERKSLAILALPTIHRLHDRFIRT